jgi:hypothetical protein
MQPVHSRKPFCNLAGFRSFREPNSITYGSGKTADRPGLSQDKPTPIHKPVVGLYWMVI